VGRESRVDFFFLKKNKTPKLSQMYMCGILYQERRWAMIDMDNFFVKRTKDETNYLIIDYTGVSFLLDRGQPYLSASQM
jgi:hypothetical protein